MVYAEVRLSGMRDRLNRGSNPLWVLAGVGVGVCGREDISLDSISPLPDARLGAAFRQGGRGRFYSTVADEHPGVIYLKNR